MIDYDDLSYHFYSKVMQIDWLKENVFYNLSPCLDKHAAQLFITASKNYGFQTKNNSTV